MGLCSAHFDWHIETLVHNYVVSKAIHIDRSNHMIYVLVTTIINEFIITVIIVGSMLLMYVYHFTDAKFKLSYQSCQFGIDKVSRMELCITKAVSKLYLDKWLPYIRQTVYQVITIVSMV